MAVHAGVVVADLPLSSVAQAIKSLYQIAGSINEFLDEHIETLKRSANETIACGGRVLEGAKFGFGLGYVSSVAIIAIGQFLLGNPLSAGGAVIAGVTGVSLFNPVVMTCAAIGAIVYGWNALSDQERADALDRLSTGLEMGVELLRSLADFVIRKTKEALSSKQLSAFKEFITTQAARFGRSLFDVTGKVGDLVKGAADKAGSIIEQAVDATMPAVQDAYGAVADGATDATNAATGAAKRVGKAASDAFDKAKGAATRAGPKAGLPTRTADQTNRPLEPDPKDKA